MSSAWRAAPADEELRRTYALEDCADDAWSPVAVPGHWASSPELADVDGSVLYRTRFPDTPVPASDLDRHPTRSWLTFDGIFYTSDVWLDGSYLGDTEGYFLPHSFEITDLVGTRAEHLLALEVACSPPTDRRRKRNLTGIFQHGELLDQRWNPGGIWRPVHVVETGPVRIRHGRVLCQSATEESGVVAVRLILDTVVGATVALRTTVYDPAGTHVLEVEREHAIAAGENRLEWAVAVATPELWWPWSLGDQPRYQVVVEVVIDDVVSDRLTRRVGLRQITMRNWIMTVNGERLFLKGSNLGPAQMDLAAASPELVAGDVTLARDVGLDLLRVNAHISRPELYEAADDQGMLLWQDLPLHWGYARSVRGQARRQAREAVDLLGHHPSIALWCGHDDPAALDIGPDTLATTKGRRRLTARYLVSQVAPTWNRTVLDRSISSELQRSDSSRPVVTHSGVLPHVPQLDGTDSHLYVGWYAGGAGDLARLLRWWPRLARFVSEFGAQSVPDDADFLEPERWPDLDWDQAWERHGLQKTFFDRTVAPADHATFDGWREATQRYQAELLREQIEALRRLKYRPTGGFAQFCLADAHPAVSWALLDHRRRPKPAWEALRAACAPVIVVADALPDHLHPGEPLTIDIHAVSDLRISSDDMVVGVNLSWKEGDVPQHRTWNWGGDLPADSCVRIAALDLVVPIADDDLVLEVTLRARHGDGEVVHGQTRRSTVFSAPHTH